MNKIIFGKEEGTLIDYNTKKVIIDYLYDKIDLNKIRYSLINIQKLKYLQNNEHYVSPNYKGYNYLLMILAINNNNYTIVIDRKKLTFNKADIDIKHLKIIKLNITPLQDMYKGTIFDGKLININNEYLFLIQDCYYLSGNKLDIDIKTKMDMLNNIIQQLSTNHFKIKLNRLHEYNDLEDLINSLSTINIPNNGLVFYPKFSASIIVFLDKKIEHPQIVGTEKIEERSISLINNFVDFLKNRKYTYENNENTKILTLSRTNIPDVYYVSKNNENIGIAAIPNLKTSHLCNTHIKDKPVKFICTYCNKVKKWIPLKLA